MNEKKTVSIEELFSDGYMEKNYPFRFFINKKVFKGDSFWGYDPYHVIFEFPKFIKNRLDDLIQEIVWAWQRVFRGWDDRAYWSVDYWLNEKMPQIIQVLIDKKAGTPFEFFDGMTPINNFGGYSNKDEETAILKWNNILNKIRSGFLANQKMLDEDYDLTKEEKENLVLEFQEGMSLFTKYYNNLWD